MEVDKCILLAHFGAHEHFTHFDLIYLCIFMQIISQKRILLFLVCLCSSVCVGQQRAIQPATEDQ